MMSAAAVRTSLWRTDGARYGRCDVNATSLGELEITHHDMGAGEWAAWGADDRELSLELPASAVAALAICLLRDRFSGRSDAFEAIRAYCDEHDIDATLSQWT
jgi:hypothetical protein